MKKTILIIFTFLIISCNAYKTEYDFTSVVFNDLRKPFNGSKIDTLRLAKDSYLVPIKLLEYYTIEKEYLKVKGIRPQSEGNFHWIDEDNPWPISNDEINFMIEELKKARMIKWNPSKFNSKIKTIKISKVPVFENHELEDKERVRMINKGDYLFTFSTPVFNKNKDIAIITYEVPLFFGSRSCLIYKKENEVWTLIGNFW